MISHIATHCHCGNDLTGRQTKYCSSSCKAKAFGSCYSSQKERRHTRKQELVNLFGGSCSRCGYNKSLAALQFHHIDPLTKSFQLDIRHLAGRTWQKILDEAKKCILLCANCHAEHHHDI